MPKYRIHVQDDEKQNHFVEVVGYPVVVADLNGMELFAHRPYGLSTGWAISEVKSGLYLVRCEYGTIKQAVVALKEMLNFNVPLEVDIDEWVKKFIRKHIKEFGVANAEASGGK